MLEIFEDAFEIVVRYAILILEAIGAKDRIIAVDNQTPL